MALDAWTALKALLPPPERRGVTLIDPAFEQTGELDRLADGLKEAVRRFATGTYLLWYPIKEAKPVAAFRSKIAELGLPKATAIELMIRGPEDETRLNGAGLVAVNAPFTSGGKLERTAAGAGTRFGARKRRGISPRGAGNRGVKRQLRGALRLLPRHIFFSDTSTARAHDRPGGDFEVALRLLRACRSYALFHSRIPNYFPSFPPVRLHASRAVFIVCAR